MLGAMAQEHERAAGAWQSEWLTLRDLLSTVGSAAAWLRDCLEHLEVDPERMRANLALTHGALLAERVTTALAPALGRQAAHELVEEAAAALTGSRDLGDVLRERPDVREHLSGEEIARLLDPSDYLGSAPELIDRALRAHHDHRRLPRP
jgi:3-carboxy-cis,cis-muconate cycloisomerase